VGGFEGVGDGGVEWKRAFQGFAFDELHNQRAFFDALHRRDVRVIQRRQGARFAFETRETIGVARDGVREDLDSHVAPEARVVGTIPSLGPRR
jgi:hypothetical protein